MITQEELSKYQRYVKQLKTKKDKIKLAEAKLKDMELGMISSLKAGEGVESGKFVCEVKRTLGKASIKWKDIVLKLKGLAYVEKLIQDADRPMIESLEVKEVL